MAKERKFSVTQPTIIIWLSSIIAIFFAVLIIVEFLTTPAPHTAITLIVTVFVFIPCAIIILWALMFRIRVTGKTIHVRRLFGIVKYSFKLSDISMVDSVEIQNRMGINYKLTIYTSNGKKVPVETLMVNSQKMIQFINENVELSKIRKTTKMFF